MEERPKLGEVVLQQILEHRKRKLRAKILDFIFTALMLALWVYVLVAWTLEGMAH